MTTATLGSTVNVLAEVLHLVLIRISAFSMSSPQPHLPRHRVLLRLLLDQVLGHRGSGEPKLMLERKIDIVELEPGALDEPARLGRHHEVRVALQVQDLELRQVDGIRQGDQPVPGQDEFFERAAATKSFRDHFELEQEQDDSLRSDGQVV